MYTLPMRHLTFWPLDAGCVVYEMIVGFSPFRSEKIYEWSGLTKKDKVGLMKDK